MDVIMPLLLFTAVCIVLLIGYPVALSLGGTALAFAAIGLLTDTFDPTFLQALPNRIYGIMTNQTLIAVPLFVFMGVMLERSKVAEELLGTMADLFGSLRGGLGISVILVGMLLAASTGIVGATVVTMGLLSLPVMLKRGYHPSIATGTICAAGTLGQIIPPSIILILLGDVLSAAYQQAQLNMGIFAPETLSVGDLFVGALIPGLLLVLFYILYIISIGYFRRDLIPNIVRNESQHSNSILIRSIKALIPPLLLIVAVLGSILTGAATPSEAAAVGAVGAIVLALSKKKLNFSVLKKVVYSTTQVTSMIFFIFIGAAIFSLVFRGFGGDEVIEEFLLGIAENNADSWLAQILPAGAFGPVLIVMLVMFLLGFILDFIEITFVVVPIIAPILLTMGVDPVWLGIMIAINLQTSFLTPPFGFALFYLRGVAPESVKTSDIYKGIIPFIIIQLSMLTTLAYWPQLATWLPGQVFN
ncbi:MAG: TRAP transporter large permease subunit [gamma proteobacterium symbiont of Bathyaustriella thionipta]|nr:TRAP transporter large permease subunit [gamma proteobacterium symbiont of Bathyaustriella thionipta]MCU7951105.1 TRAP transporter large permease subunit [gamma proteobacterium symbiont of Bathyaustriella thionipta]MCU7951975.1 TRAP transporter large permease subunit [gamma proteobacterium symbiont of Bathyaustriella thionipta]MCU7957614.1 TRAP transporter large permease subunit [gamma proteobacterium symbiont of Bathyaustriella thionipta]MCU7968752.1 TRAP transporter large permease subunit 